MNAASHISNADLTFRPPHRTSTTTSLPPDVASSRQSRINQDILAYFKRPASRRNSTPSNTEPPFLKGIGVYTHIEVAPAPPESLFPHQRFAQPAPRIEFLPLGGFGQASRKGALKADLPEDVKTMYSAVKGVVLWAEREARKPDQPDPRDKFGGLGLPGVNVPSPQSMGGGSEDMDIDETEDGQLYERPGNERRSSVGTGTKGLDVSERRTSTPGDVAMGGTSASITRTAVPVPSSAAKTTSDNTASTATVASTNASGTIYDASRDPRRRGR